MTGIVRDKQNTVAQSQQNETMPVFISEVLSPVRNNMKSCL